MDMPALALIAIVLVTVAAGIALGVLVERLRWNALIHKGVLPAPVKHEKSSR